MKKIVLGLAIGLGAYCLYKKLHQEGCLDECCEDKVNGFFSKARKNFRNKMDMSKNEAEYLRERAEFAANKGKEKLDNLMN